MVGSATEAKVIEGHREFLSQKILKTRVSEMTFRAICGDGGHYTTYINGEDGDSLSSDFI